MSRKVIGGRYELLEKIGDGGMAIVYKAVDRLLNRNVAIKILKPEFTMDTKFIENFRKESHAAASLSHPNIVGVYDVGREGNINYIVMELVEGETLSELISENGPMEYHDVIDITRQIASGLSAAHKHGIIHRDVKPHNVLINEEGVAKITDFGIAKAVSAATIVDETGQTIMGSVHYFSPEQAKGAHVDERSDIYSLGIVMYEMLTGEVPFDGDNPVSVALMHVNETMQTPSQIVEGIPHALERVVMKATSKNPEGRYQSVQEFIEALDDLTIVSRVVGTDARTRVVPAAAVAAAEGTDDDKKKELTPEEAKKRKRKKIIVIGSAVLAAAVIFVVAGIFMGAFSRPVNMPDLRGKTYAEAQDICDEKGLKLKEGKMVYSTKYDAGEVAKQDPGQMESVKKGETVTVNLSKGATEGTVPNLIGMDEDDAKDMIKKYDFKVGEVTEEDSDKPKGEVIKQDPSPGDEVEEGSKINLVVSSGVSNKKEVPDLRGMTQSEASAALEKLGLHLGDIDYAASDKYSKGTVMAQEYKTGTEVDKGTYVNITISNGASGDVNLYVDYGSATSSVFYMTVTVTDDNGTRNVVSNKQCQKSDGGERLTISGTGTGTIIVTFDTTTVLNKTVNFATGELK